MLNNIDSTTQYSQIFNLKNSQRAKKLNIQPEALNLDPLENPEAMADLLLDNDNQPLNNLRAIVQPDDARSRTWNTVTKSLCFIAAAAGTIIPLTLGAYYLTAHAATTNTDAIGAVAGTIAQPLITTTGLMWALRRDNQNQSTQTARQLILPQYDDPQYRESDEDNTEFVKNLFGATSEADLQPGADGKIVLKHGLWSWHLGNGYDYESDEQPSNSITTTTSTTSTSTTTTSSTTKKSRGILDKGLWKSGLPG